MKFSSDEAASKSPRDNFLVRTQGVGEEWFSAGGLRDILFGGGLPKKYSNLNPNPPKKWEGKIWKKSAKKTGSDTFDFFLQLPITQLPLQAGANFEIIKQRNRNST